MLGKTIIEKSLLDKILTQQDEIKEELKTLKQTKYPEYKITATITNPQDVQALANEITPILKKYGALILTAIRL